MTKQFGDPGEKAAAIAGIVIAIAATEGWQWLKYSNGHGIYHYILHSDTTIAFKVLAIGLPHLLIAWWVWRLIFGKSDNAA